MSNRKIYRQLAKKHGVSAKEIKNDMQSALNQAYQTPSQNEITAAYQNRVVRKGEVPTTNEFLSYAKAEVKKRSK